MQFLKEKEVEQIDKKETDTATAGNRKEGESTQCVLGITLEGVHVVTHLSLITTLGYRISKVRNTRR